MREFDIAARSTDVFGRVMCSARTHHFIVDGPAYNGCAGEEITPGEVFLSAVAACGVELIQVIAREQSLPVGRVAVTVRGTVDRERQERSDLTTFNTVRLAFTLSGTDEATAGALVDGFKRRCPLFGTVAAAVKDVQVSFVVAD